MLFMSKSTIYDDRVYPKEIPQDVRIYQFKCSTKNHKAQCLCSSFCLFSPGDLMFCRAETSLLNLPDLTMLSGAESCNCLEETYLQFDKYAAFLIGGSKN